MPSSKGGSPRLARELGVRVGVVDGSEVAVLADGGGDVVLLGEVAHAAVGGAVGLHLAALAALLAAILRGALVLVASLGLACGAVVGCLGH